jgi:hypothetical protein
VEGKIALQRQKTGQPLDERQKLLVETHDELMAVHNRTAAREQHARHVSAQPQRGIYIPGDAMPFATNQNRTLRVNGAAEYIAKVNADKEHPYWKTGHPEHKGAALARKLAYQIVENGEASVTIGENGLVETEKE